MHLKGGRMRDIQRDQLIRMIPVALIFCVLMSAVIFAWTASERSIPGNVRIACIASVPTELSALLYIAEARGCFCRNGLDIVIRDCATSGEALDMMRSGKVRMAACSEFDMVDRALGMRGVQAIATIAQYQTEIIVSRAEHPIRSRADLKNSRVGLERNTAAEYCLAKALEAQGLEEGYATVVDVGPDYLLHALSGGYVDAAAVWQPSLASISGRHAGDYSVWPIDLGRKMSWNLACTDSDLNGNRGIVRQLLSSLRQAEKYVRAHPAEAMEIVKWRTGLDGKYVNLCWGSDRFSLTPDGSLIALMEDEARWMLGRKASAGKSPPDFLSCLSPVILETVRHESIPTKR